MSYPLSSLSRVRAVRRALSFAAQDVYDEWDPGADGVDVSGCLTKAIAERMLAVLKTEGIDAAIASDGTLAVRTSDGIYRIEVPSQVYETAAGYNWRKTHGVTITTDNLHFNELSKDPNAWEEVTGLRLRSDEHWVSPKNLYTEPVKAVLAEVVPHFLKDGWAPVKRDPIPFKPAEQVPAAWLQATGVKGETPRVITVNEIPKPHPFPMPPPISPMEWTAPLQAESTPNTTASVTNTPPIPPPTETVPSARAPLPWSEPIQAVAATSAATTVSSTPAPPTPPNPPAAEPVAQYDPATDIMRPSPVVVLKDRY